MILGTAGHVDHGKTTLVRALTGVETDRLAEERRRGMTIDLGFAYAGEGEQRVGIVDVPGHERFLATMVAGVSGIAAVLFCVAADEGPRPQTHEHLRVLDLLGVARGIVVLTRADRAEPARIAAVAEEMRALLAGTGLAGAPILAVSAVTGEGIDALRTAIAALRQPVPAPRGAARLAVDRAFVIDGAGVVAAGLLSAGRLAVGDAVVVSPAGIPARVRGLRANDRPVEAALAGARVAVNLAGEGIAAGVVARGDWIVAPRLHVPTLRLDARLVGLAGRLPRAGTLHAGAAHVSVRLEALGEGLAALLLGRALPLLAGDRVLLRGPEGAVLCGGLVLDPAPPARGRRAPARLAQLDALGLPNAQAAAALLALPPGWVDADAFARARNLDDSEAAWRDLGAVRLGRWAVAPPAWTALAVAIETALAAHHAAQPESPGLGAAALRAALPNRPPPDLLEATLDRFAVEGRIARAGPLWRLPDHAPSLAPAERVRADALLGPLVAAALRPRAAHDLAAEAGIEARTALATLRRLARLGEAVEVAPGRFLAGTVLPTLAAALLAARDSDGLVRPGPFRDAAGCGRNMAIVLLEWLDRIGVTVRRGEARVVREDRLGRLAQAARA
ncbi:selenocysteine-specific translation elongation factor [Elioraea tepidiphila]|uniref:selenocysteine-specific translation elongation factor n=1 Tax=Elioraea tepidiphila TaxID=457934 RepID=UPI002FD88C5F